MQTPSFISFLLLFLSSPFQVMANNVISDDHRVSRIGRMRSYYDQTKEDFCKTLLILGVGTGMRTNSYDELSNQIAMSSDSITFIVDPNPWFLTKNSERKFARLVEYVRTNIGNLIPVCQGIPVETLIIGGHSASGGAAWRAIPLLEKADGYLGLDPYRLEPKDEKNIPTLNWGTSKTSCGVTLNNAAKASYVATVDAGRVFYQVNNNNDGKGHCDFSDNGCYGAICSLSDNAETVRQTVAFSVNRFIQSLKDNKTVSKTDFLPPNEMSQIMLFVNEDSVGSRRTVYLRR